MGKFLTQGERVNVRNHSGTMYGLILDGPYNGGYLVQLYERQQNGYLRSPVKTSFVKTDDLTPFSKTEWVTIRREVLTHMHDKLAHMRGSLSREVAPVSKPIHDAIIDVMGMIEKARNKG